MLNRTFGGLTKEYSLLQNSDIILQSVPYDGTSTWGKGADRGFESFIEASENMELYDIETKTEVYKHGIHIPEAWTDFDSPEAMFKATYHGTKELLKLNKFLTFFGGEHSVSIGIMKAFNEHYNQLTVLQLDAHADLRPSYDGTQYNHACALHQVSQEANLIQVGIRSMDITETAYWDPEKVYLAQDIHKNNQWQSDSIVQMTDDVYITLDLDVLDPSIMPATGTPEPGGMDWYAMMSYLKRVFKEKNVVGFDIVELAPIEGFSAPQFLTSKLYYKMLSYQFSKH